MGIGFLAASAKLPRSLVVFSLVLLVVFNPAKLIYRQLVGYRTGDFTGLSMGDAADAWGESLGRVWGGDERAQEQGIEKTVERLNNLTINAAVLAWVPDRVPYAMGEPWLAALYSLVPRFIWPDKPNITEITNDRFAILFGMTTADIASRSTSAYPAVGDGFWNFGWFGAALAGLLAGLFWRLAYFFWTPSSRMSFVLPFLVLVSTKATIALPKLIGGVFQMALACFVVVKAFEIASMLRPRSR
jgi:hypothetical protein